ncbi:restriction endonuclease subunit S [Planktothrix agardhii]|uniref:restriction endonuclease subunit S n=1 Tax=Planktothrix agardhii TaxID=1160 RepID=UPI001D0B8892|nr:restriction endonuclease subunit S [Planktothrix agardhii]MCB8758462.1 restriction endonuclease subunit S [Planktothrix agardhii 1813]
MNLPEGWKITTLGEVSEFINGDRGKNYPNQKDFITTGIPFINAGHIQNGNINFDSMNYISDQKFNCLGSGKVQHNDILYCLRGSLGKNAIVNDIKKGAIASSLVIIRPHKNISTKYLYYFLNSPLGKTEIYKYDNGSSQPNLSAKSVKSYKIPLPPIASQRTIANILDKADEIIRKRKEAIALTEQLQKSIFLDMFGDPVINPKGWEVNKVIDYCDCIVPGRDKPKSFTGSIPWITTADLKFLDKTYFSNLNMKLSENEIKEVNAKIIPKNSVLLTCVGDLGVTSIAGCDMVVNQQLHSFQCKNINNYFLMYALPYQKIFMYKRATQTTVPYMNKNTCNSIPIIYPPRKLQEKFGILIAEINNKKGLYLKALQESENLFNSLLQKAFKGEL